MLDFVHGFLRCVKHPQTERVFLTCGLIDLFTKITEANSIPKLKWQHFTSFIIENVIESDLNQNAVASKFVSKKVADKYQVAFNSNELQNHAAEVFGGSDLCLRRIFPSRKLMDSQHHVHGIKNALYIATLRRVLCIDNLAERVSFYDEQGHLDQEIYPNKENHMIDTSILDFVYSKAEQRIGACLQDYSLSFWDQNDNFKFEKSFPSNLDSLSVFIFYVEFCTTWLTADL